MKIQKQEVGFEILVQDTNDYEILFASLDSKRRISHGRQRKAIMRLTDGALETTRESRAVGGATECRLIGSEADIALDAVKYFVAKTACNPEADGVDCLLAADALGALESVDNATDEIMQKFITS